MARHKARDLMFPSGAAKHYPCPQAERQSRVAATVGSVSPRGGSHVIHKTARRFVPGRTHVTQSGTCKLGGMLCMRRKAAHANLAAWFSFKALRVHKPQVAGTLDNLIISKLWKFCFYKNRTFATYWYLTSAMPQQYYMTTIATAITITIALAFASIKIQAGYWRKCFLWFIITLFSICFSSAE